MTTATEVQIVEARKEHIPFVAWVVMAANRSHLPKGMWDINVGGSEEDVLRYLEVLADTEQVHWAHYSLFKVADSRWRKLTGCRRPACAGSSRMSSGRWQGWR